jgi:hypothetical protein
MKKIDKIIKLSTEKANHIDVFPSMEDYIISDDKIKENDYYLTDAGIFKCYGNETERELSKFKKVIASDNSDVKTYNNNK